MAASERGAKADRARIAESPFQELVHIFGAIGTRLVMQTGCCGALADEIEAGDLFVPTETFCGEGTAQYYHAGGRLAFPSSRWPPIAVQGEATDVPVHRGRLFTTAALLAEGEHEIENWHRQGWAAVDMETATTLAVATHFGMDRFLKVIEDGQLVGSVRAFQDEEACHVERLVVHPDYGRRGIGLALLKMIETCFPAARRFELFTGQKSESNIRLYERIGYRGVRQERLLSSSWKRRLSPPRKQIVRHVRFAEDNCSISAESISVSNATALSRRAATERVSL
jgi:ribosomal protein S18 acetylase RimI-like enzyme